VTQLEAMDQFDRLAALGFRAPADPDGKPGAVFLEWYDGLKGFAVDDVKDGIGRLRSTRTDTFWPTVGELRGIIAGLTSGRESRRCQNCQGSGWVEARPYKANAGHIYEGVERCPACAIPMPKDAHGTFQTPLTDREYAEWQAKRIPLRAITSRAEVFDRIKAVLGVDIPRRERAS
jgi:hypothetical protein